MKREGWYACFTTVGLFDTRNSYGQRAFGVGEETEFRANLVCFCLCACVLSRVCARARARVCVRTRTSLIACLGVFTFCICCILICLVCFVASFKLCCV